MSFHLVCILSSFLGVIVFPFNYICEFWENLGGCELYKVTEIGGTATIYISWAFTPLCSSDPLLSVTAVCQFNAAECCSLRWQKSVCFQTTNPFERLRLLLSMFFVFFFVSSFISPSLSLSLPAQAKRFIPCLEGRSLAAPGRANGGCAHRLNKCWSSLQFKLSVTLICCLLGAAVIKFKPRFYVNWIYGRFAAVGSCCR